MVTKRTTKSLASRIQMDYLNRFRPILYWKRVAMGAAAGLAVLWIAWGTIYGKWVHQKENVLAPGPVSSVHQSFGNQCSACHASGWEKVQNNSCLNCHADLKHHEKMIADSSASRCGSCHVEHEGNLIHTVQNNNCVACHGDLHTNDGSKAEVHASIHSFEKDHPEFNFISTWKDSAPIKLNHKVHLRPDLPKVHGGLDAEKVTLTCSSCHEVDVKNDPKAYYRNADINYEKHCASCHELGFDDEFKEKAPHEKPEIVKAYVEKFFADKSPVLEDEKRRRPGPDGQVSVYSNADEWRQMKIKKAEDHLFGKVCVECHTWNYKAGELPEAPEIHGRKEYLDKGGFNHAMHRPIACASCHRQAAGSEKTSDVLVPGKEVCVECHAEGKIASNKCMTCHQYHSSGHEKIMEGQFPVP